MEADGKVWVLNYPDIAPAFMIAEAGFDVWLGNNRGCRYSIGHVSLDTQSKEFWDFDWEEMGIYDVPAEIDFILNLTGHSNLTYIGHSQGSTQMMIGLSMIPDYYDKKLNLFIALNPAIRMANITDHMTLIAASKQDKILARIEKHGTYNLFAPNETEQLE